LSMLNAIVTSSGQRETWFFYGCRNGGEHMMKEHLARIARTHANVHLHVCYSGPSGDDVEGSDYQHEGRVSVDLMKKLLPSSNYDFFICGPPPMMDATVEGLIAWDVPEARVHFEKFGPGAPRKKPEPESAGDTDVETVAVEFKKSGKTLQWSPAAGTLFDLAQQNDIEIDSGCQQGNCGTCQTAIHSGKVNYLSEPSYECESGTCLVCCCVPDGAIVVDA
jgi:ferredoxin-NADP reductase